MGIVTAMGLYTAALLINNTIQGFSALIAGVKAAADMMAAGAGMTVLAVWMILIVLIIRLPV